MTGAGVRLAALALSWTAVGAGHALRGRLWRGLAWFGLTAAMFLALPWTGFAGLIFALLVRFLVAPADSALVLPGPPPRVHVVVLVSAGLVLASVLGAMAVRVYFVEAFKVPSAGMAPTLAVGDLFFVDKRATDPAVGDVIVFRHPQRPERDFVQRVVGVAGDRIAVRGGALSRNGAAVPTRALERPCSLDDRARSSGRARWTTAPRAARPGSSSRGRAPSSSSGGTGSASW